MIQNEGKLPSSPQGERLDELLTALEDFPKDPHGEIDWGEEQGREKVE